jgi:Flp pilus assembly protein TadG
MFRSAEPKRSSLPCQRRSAGIVSDESGAVAVEFSLVIGLLVAVIAATLQFGMALKARNEMSYSLSRVARMITLDGTQTPAQVSALVTDRLSDYDQQLLSVNAAESVVAGTRFMEISVSYPYETAIPLHGLSTLNLMANTMVPLVSSTK